MLGKLRVSDSRVLLHQAQFGTIPDYALIGESLIRPRFLC